MFVALLLAPKIAFAAGFFKGNLLLLLHLIGNIEVLKYAKVCSN